MDIAFSNSLLHLERAVSTTRFCISQKFDSDIDTDSYLTDALFVHLIQEHQEFHIEGVIDFFKRQDTFCITKIVAHQFAQSPLQEIIAASLIASSRHSVLEPELVNNLKDYIEREVKFHPQSGLLKDLSHTLIILYSIAKLNIWNEEKLSTHIDILLSKHTYYRGLDSVFLVKLAALVPQNQKLSFVAKRQIELPLELKDAEEKLFFYYARLWYYTQLKDNFTKDYLLEAIAFIKGIPLEEFQVGTYFEDYKVPGKCKWPGSVYPCFLLGYTKIVLDIYNTIMSEERIQSEQQDFKQLVDDNGRQIMLQKPGEQFVGSPFKVLKSGDKYRFTTDINVQVNDIILDGEQAYKISSVQDYSSNGVVVGKEVKYEPVRYSSPAAQINNFYNNGVNNSPVQVGGTGNTQNVNITQSNNTEIIFKLIELLQQLPKEDLPIEILSDLELAKSEAAKPSPIWGKVANGVKGALTWTFNNPDKAGVIVQKVNDFIATYGPQMGQLLQLQNVGL
ncbi:hypothetical protein [Adhaeribacter radiodurans]|uniref:Uncharacterized protein n=1 Tax=Adhaeribacter radiodurans TaxID=2745197 RepID=A0A7L7L266_9BACT|nr:hypothetical protein [Adhaeribacter radiodurans]QMU26549.1 hypothetical protein HUW48_00315 [Adhaeribacter radiodurans]